MTTSDEPRQVIPTTYRQKLPAGWSYAIGAERLSRILEGVPQFPSLTVSFYPSELFFLSDRVRALDSGLPVAVCSIRHENLTPGLTGSNDGIALGWYGEKWAVRVHAVPSPHKRVAAEAIVAAAERLRSWLATPRPETWRDGSRGYAHHTCAVHLRLKDGEVTFHQE